MVRSCYSFVAVEVKCEEYNKTLNVRFLGKPVSFVFPRVLMFLSTLVSGNIRTLGKTKLFPSGSDIKCILLQGRNMIYGLWAQSPKYDRDQGSGERAQGSEEWDQGSQGF